EPAPFATAPPVPSTADVTVRLEARRLGRRLSPSWEMTSFTGLVSGLDPERPDYDAGRTTMVPAAPPTRAHDLFGFERGARAGRCLHWILEHVDYAGDATGWAPVVRN